MQNIYIEHLLEYMLKGIKKGNHKFTTVENIKGEIIKIEKARDEAEDKVSICLKVPMKVQRKYMNFGLKK